ncbi:MAG TPA: glycosyltransferase family 4 protein [Thermoanaerobaculia bacterium]|jgi:glycosyltransferase involved in cell wall biosynthesis
MSAGTLRGVCILVTDLDSTAGGVQVQSQRVARGLGELGVATWILTRNYTRAPRREVRGSTVILRSPVIRRSLAPANSLLYLLCCLWWLLRLRRQYDVIHCQQMFGSATAGLLAKFLLRKPVVVRVTSTGVEGEVADLRRMRGTRFRTALLRRVDRWIALTPLMRSEILSLGIAPERVVLVPNSAAIPEAGAFDAGVRARHRAILGLGDVPHAVYSSRLSAEKGLDTLLDAWSRVVAAIPDARLLILGAGGAYRNVEEEIRAQRTRLRLEQSVELRGHVDNVRDYLLACDVFVLPTRTEGMSNALIEAMASGIAVVTTRIPPHEGVVEDGENALLVSPGDVDALAAAILRLFREPRFAEQLGRAARAKALREHALPEMIRRHVAVFSELATSAR